MQFKGFARFRAGSVSRTELLGRNGAAPPLSGYRGHRRRSRTHSIGSFSSSAAPAIWSAFERLQS